jgi:hypothetical protein
VNRKLAAVVFAVVAVVAGACSGNGPTASSGQQLPTVKRGHPSTPPPYTFTFQPVDYKQGGSDSRVTGITEKANVIVGLNGTTPNSYSSWTAHTPLPLSTAYREFRTKNYPGAAGTYMSTMTNAFYQAGTVFSPPPNGNLACTTCGIVHYNQGSGTGYNGGCGITACLWTFIQDPNEGTGICAVTEVLGLAGTSLVVGYYEKGASSCGSQAFEASASVSGETFADFNVPGADPNTTQATGVNEKGQTVGSAEFSGLAEGWYYDAALYSTQLAAPGSTGTYPLGINWEGQVVGYYTDSKQNSHGFLLLNPAAPPSQQIWETVDEPVAVNYTVVSAINTHRSITGWYKDAYGHLHGFVGTCTSGNC